MAGNFLKLLLIFFCIFSSCHVYSAQPKKTVPPQTIKEPVAKAGELVKTADFKITIPNGWFMPEQVKKMPDGISAVFAKERSGLAVTVNVLKIPMSAQGLASRTAENMKKSGLKPSPPVKDGALYRVDFSGQVVGRAWFGANGKVCAATVVIGPPVNPGLDKAGELLKALTPAIPAIFPDH